MTATMKATRMRHIIQDAVARTWRDAPPRDEYAVRVCKLLEMTWAHESNGGMYARQMRYNPSSEGGAAGEFQMEMGAVRACIIELRKWPLDSRQRIGRWIFDDPNQVDHWLDFIDEVTGFKLLVLSDKWAAVLARVYYLMRPGEIPIDNLEKAKYAKEHWNTYLGKATWQDYFDAHAKHFGGK